MKRIFWILSLSAILAVTAVSAAAPANFAGSWTLDKSKSQNLPRQWENAESIVLDIKQDDKQITIENKVAGSSFPSQPATYHLDGSETSMEMQGRMPGKATLKASWSTDGNTLQLNSRRTIVGQNNEEMSFTTTEKLTLSEGGKILTNVRHSEGPRGTQDSTLVYVKK